MHGRDKAAATELYVHNGTRTHGNIFISARVLTTAFPLPTSLFAGVNTLLCSLAAVISVSDELTYCQNMLKFTIILPDMVPFLTINGTHYSSHHLLMQNTYQWDNSQNIKHKTCNETVLNCVNYAHLLQDCCRQRHPAELILVILIDDNLRKRRVTNDDIGKIFIIFSMLE